MTYPRAHLVDPQGGVYHVCSRCVRRAFLCGFDEATGYNFDHRRQWIEDRILALADLFAVDLYGYAVMSNHYHIVLRVDPAKLDALSNEDIADRWLTLCPIKSTHPDIKAKRHRALASDDERIQELRQRLASLSWFMRYLNEPLARLANKEDGCKGRFWEGRFQSQRLLDENAILACMVYVDLNPLRAGISDEPTKSDHTSLARRVATTPRDTDTPLKTLNGTPADLPITQTLGSYIALVKWTLAARQTDRLSQFKGIPPQDQWLHLYSPQPGCWQRALGSVQSLKDYANEVGQHWIKRASPQALPQSS